MLVDVLEELLDVWVSARVQVRIVYVDHDAFKIVFLLVPLKVLLEVGQREGLEENLNAQVFEIVGLQ